ncbi:MAG: hypothetical protein H0W00_02565, partial [Chloroflexi bacterium]|nr:hypothetical protein [Chloroflexota bacterium]
MRRKDLPELDVRAVAEAYEGRVTGAIPELRSLALRTLDRVGPQQWRLEWHLPWWLGDELGLPADVSREIVLSNVLGLASIRLEDDLIDGDIAADEIASAKALSIALYREAVELYRSHFDDASLFWSRLDSYMTEWRSATSNAAPDTSHGRGDALVRRLARRGAPLKISALAVCLLADQEHRFLVVHRCLGWALAAMVLYDQFVDWEEDLAAGRWNAFVASAAPYPRAPSVSAGQRSAVLVAMMTAGAVSEHFGRVHAAAVRATGFAEQVGSPP